MPDNRREFARISATGKVGLVLQGKLCICTASDVSIGGAALHTHADLQPGQQVMLHVSGLGQLPATVVRHASDSVAIAFDVDSMNQTGLLETWRDTLDRGGQQVD